MTNKKDFLFEYMASEFVQVVIDKDYEETKQTEEGVNTKKCPIIAYGYLVDEDDSYIYLGPAPDTISQAVQKEYIVHIELTSEEEQENSLKDMSDLPSEEKGWN